MEQDWELEEIVAFVGGLDGVFVQRAEESDGSPEIAWGDIFFSYAPGASAPPATQPFATIVTKDYSGEPSSGLDRPGVFRVNVAAGKDAFVDHVGREPRDPPTADEPGPDTLDVVIAHPTYAAAGWLAVVAPGPEAAAVLRDLLRQAHGLARTRFDRRS